MMIKVIYNDSSKRQAYCQAPKAPCKILHRKKNRRRPLHNFALPHRHTQTLLHPKSPFVPTSSSLVPSINIYTAYSSYPSTHSASLILISYFNSSILMLTSNLQNPEYNLLTFFYNFVTLLFIVVCVQGNIPRY
jgi:hypothetical protein